MENEKLEMFIAGLLAAIAILTTLYLASKIDSKREEEIQRYENCIAEKFSTNTPARFIANYRIEHGIYPECLSK